MIRKYVLTGAIIGSSFLGFSQSGNKAKDASDLQLNTITTAVPFLQITPDSRSGAMGDVGTALSPTSASLFWNTSMLSFSKESSEVSLSYSPWLQNLSTGISMAYLSGYYKVDDRNAVGMSFRYFSLGNIQFTDEAGNKTVQAKPDEFELLAGYAFKLNDHFSLGLNGKFIYSNLTAGVTVQGTENKAGMAGAADVSFSYRNEDVRYGSLPGKLAFGITLNDVGNKISYTADNERDFLPTNLKLGTALTFDFDKYNSLTWALDVSKLLVPTPPIINSNTGEIMAGRSSNVGVVQGIIQSFYDAPGALVKDDDGNYVQNADGSYKVEKGSKFKEEMSEIMIATGLEYWYNELFAARMGYFYESRNKGDRMYLTFGIGLRYKLFGIDFSYLTALRRNSPLQNTLRFTLRLHLGSHSSNSGTVKPQ